MGQLKTEHKRYQFFDGERTYFVDGDSQEAKYVDTPIPKEAVWQVAVGSGLLEGETVLGQESLLGRSCEVRQSNSSVMSLKEWVWEGIVLKKEARATRTEEFLEAIEIEMNPPIDQELFEVPEGYQLSSMGSIADIVQEAANTLEQPKDFSQELMKDQDVDEQVSVVSEGREVGSDPRMASVRKRVRGAQTQYAISEIKIFLLAAKTQQEAKGHYPETIKAFAQGELSSFTEERISKMESEKGIGGYRYTYELKEPSRFELYADPMKKELRVIFADQSGIVRYDGPDGPVVAEEPDA